MEAAGLETLQALRKRAHDLQAEQARAEVQVEQAKARIDEALDKLRAEFGVADLAEAQALKQRLEAELRQEMEGVSRALDEAGV